MIRDDPSSSFSLSSSDDDRYDGNYREDDVPISKPNKNSNEDPYDNEENEENADNNSDDNEEDRNNNGEDFDTADETDKNQSSVEFRYKGPRAPLDDDGRVVDTPEVARAKAAHLAAYAQTGRGHRLHLKTNNKIANKGGDKDGKRYDYPSFFKDGTFFGDLR